VAGKAEMRRPFAADRDHILGRAVRRFAHHPPVAREAERSQRGLEHIEHCAARRSHARDVDQLGCELDWIDWPGHGRSPSNDALARKRALSWLDKCISRLEQLDDPLRRFVERGLANTLQM
jgi:alpha-beta hydrolase superfamily lysophospholipase